MQSVEFKDVERLAQKFEELGDAFSKGRGPLMQEIGTAMLDTVQRNIGGSGKVQGWQSSAVGSKLGYAAVRPKPKTYVETKGGKRYAVGRITNAIEHGHKVRPPSGMAKRYRPSKKHFKLRVEGRGFYSAAEPDVERIAFEAAERFVDELAANFEKE